MSKNIKNNEKEELFDFDADPISYTLALLIYDGIFYFCLGICFKYLFMSIKSFIVAIFS